MINIKVKVRIRGVIENNKTDKLTNITIYIGYKSWDFVKVKSYYREEKEIKKDVIYLSWIDILEINNVKGFR